MSERASEQEVPRELLWRCRRGMRELDVLLLRWLHARWAVSPQHEQHSFRQLLEAEDDQLWDWLLARSRPETEELRHIVHEIRKLAVAD